LDISTGRTDLQPQSCALANRGQLRRLKVCKAQCGQVAILTRESGEAIDHNCQFLEDECDCSAYEDEVRIAAMMS
jgi:hypothetical protein